MKPYYLIACFFLINSFSQAQWEPDVRLTNNPYESGTGGLATSGDTIHGLINTHPAPGAFELEYIRSVDGGESWEPAIQLTVPPSYACLPYIVASGPIVQVAWNDTLTDPQGNTEIHYIRSLNGGSAWGEISKITDNSHSGMPCLAVFDSVTHLVYQAGGSPEIYYKRSFDFGSSWEEDVRLTNNYAQSEYPFVCASDSLVHVVWEDKRDGNWEIYYKRSADQGLTWGEDTRLTINDSSSYGAVIRSSGASVYMVWNDKSDGNREIYFKRSLDGGLTWEAGTRLTYDFNNSYSVDLSVSGIALYVVWNDSRDDSQEIYFKKSTDGGLTWGPDTRLTFDAASSYRPSIAISGTQLNVVWSDGRDGIQATYYKRDPNGNIPVGIKDDPPVSIKQPIEIYPNPACQRFNISIQSPGADVESSASASFSNNKVFHIRITDIYGKIVKEFNKVSSFPYEVDIADLPTGIYIIRIIGENDDYTCLKFIKVRG